MANDILKTLQAMESELAAIKSAKEQVESVIAADTAINSNLDSYANALSSLSNKLNLIKDSLEGIAITVNDETGKFSTSLNTSKADIEFATNKLSGLINEFKTQTEVLGIKSIAEATQQIQLVCEGMKTKLSELELQQQNSITIILQSLDNSNANLKKHTDNAKEIETKVSEISSSISSFETEIKHSISTIENSLTSKSMEILDKVSSTERTIKKEVADDIISTIENSLTSKSMEILDKVSSTERTIKKEVADDMKNIQDTSEQSIKNAISAVDKKLMWIGIFLIVLVCVDIILHFI